MKPMRVSQPAAANEATVVPHVSDENVDDVECGAVPSSLDANRLFLDKYRALDRAGQFEQSFPAFTDASIAKEYRAWNQQSVSLIPLTLASITIVLTLVITRYSLESLFLGRYENSFTILAQVSTIPGLAAFATYLFPQLYLLHCRRHPISSDTSEHDRDVILARKQLCERCLEYPLEDIVCILSTLTIVFMFLGRVAAGACPDSVNLWEAQRCNPLAGSNSFPQDDLITFYLVPVYFTMMSRGVSIYGNLISYAIAAAAVLYSMEVVHGQLQSYSLLWLGVYAMVTLELERWLRVSFVRHKLLVDSRQTAVAAAENEAKQVIFAAHVAQTAAENAAKILDLDNKAHLAVREQDMLRHIMGNVAHDMKTPLHSIIAELEGVRDAVDEACNEAAKPAADAPSVLARLQSTAHNTLGVVESMTQFLVMSINRSQDYAKLTSNIALKPNLETVSIPDVLRFVTKCMAHQNNGRKIIVHPLGTVCAAVITDSHFLKDNLLCLVSNAVKYADAGATIDVRVSLVTASSSSSSQPSTHLDHPMVMVIVEDTGIGISDEKKAVLFQPFKQAQRSAGGTGLGLFSLAGRIKALGGTCGMRDRDDGKQGSVFWFTFPYRPDAMGSAADDGIISRMASPRVAEAQPRLLSPLRILLTDDSASILKVTKRFLEKHGHAVETAENGSQTLKRLQTNRDAFDLLITDLQMPVMDGFESVRRFRELERQQQQQLQPQQSEPHQSYGESHHEHKDLQTQQHAPSLQPGGTRLFILGMSAKADEETKSDVFAVGMDAFVPKPFDYKTLVDELKRSPAFTETMKRRQRKARSSPDVIH